MASAIFIIFYFFISVWWCVLVWCGSSAGALFIYTHIICPNNRRVNTLGINNAHKNNTIIHMGIFIICP